MVTCPAFSIIRFTRRTYREFLNGLIHAEDLGKDLVVVESFQVNGSGAAGGHAQPAALAQHRIDLGLAGMHARIGIDEGRC